MLRLVLDRDHFDHRKQTAHRLLPDNRSGRMRDDAAILYCAHPRLSKVDQMKKLVSFILVSAALAFPSSASAVAFCEGAITQTLTYANGGVMIRGAWRNSWMQICNVKTEWKGVTPEVCYVWFSYASSAVTENKPVTVYYSTLDQAECATMPTYSGSPAPAYVMLKQ